LRFSADAPAAAFGTGFEKTFAKRIAEADQFYDRITPASLSEDQRLIHRQALAGMLWTKQFYYFDVDLCLRNTTVIRSSVR
jgi:hypothetical protein